MVLLIRPRATLGQKESLIKSITQISKPPVRWQSNTATLQWQTESHNLEMALRPEWSGQCMVSLRAPSRTLLLRRTRMPVGRTSPSTRLDERLERPADVPYRRQRQRPRRRPTALRLTLQPLPRRQRRQRPDAGRRSRSRPGEPTHLSCALRGHTSCCLRRRPRSQPTYPGSRSRPAGRRSTLRSLGNSVDDPDVAQGTAVPI